MPGPRPVPSSRRRGRDWWVPVVSVAGFAAKRRRCTQGGNLCPFVHAADATENRRRRRLANSCRHTARKCGVTGVHPLSPAAPPLLPGIDGVFPSVSPANPVAEPALQLSEEYISFLKGAENVENSDWEGLREMLIELVMWKSPARSAFWFGSRSMLFLSSSFSRDINFSPISVLCHFGVVTLVLAFIKDSIPQRQHVEQIRSVQLTEEDVRRAARAVLPIAHSPISMAQVIFSGDPSMTLKVS